MVDFIPTRYEFIVGEHTYTATCEVGQPWMVTRWKTEGPCIPPYMETLYNTGWKPVLQVQEGAGRMTFPHINDVWEFVDPQI